ncbi:MAG: GPI inositol-deacylase [Candidatus Promineofilum sp.]|uniref:esterase/lipase family protein n=1 Tax=Promineifilum sp. TaxID=2664178 RepID=UPI002411C17F|nr:GPI inositol-deacylase [Promineifilum sp.]
MTASTGSNKVAHFHPSDLRALARVATDAAAGIIELVEDVHMRVVPPAAATGLAPLTYRTLRGAARVVGNGAEMTLAQVSELLGRREDSAQRRAALAVLNGLWGDYLARTDSPLALPMAFRYGDGALSPPRRKIVVLIHGLCMDDRGWARNGLAAPHDHGAALARDLGYSAVYLSYNSGLHISTNGRGLAIMLQALLEAWPVPVEELALVGHSMGGLVARSAGHYGPALAHEWPARLRSVVFLGTPHHGAPLERGGNWLNVMIDASPYMAPFGRLGKRRSAGITDLRYGSLVDEDWLGRDRFAPAPDDRCLVPPLPGVGYYAAAATLGGAADSPATRLLGDGLVPLDSALGRHANAGRCLSFDKTNSWVGYGMSHLDLLGHPAVYARLRDWLA